MNDIAVAGSWPLANVPWEAGFYPANSIDVAGAAAAPPLADYGYRCLSSFWLFAKISRSQGLAWLGSAATV
jgi:hypothetical protein